MSNSPSDFPPVVPVAVIDNAEHAVNLAAALAEGGMPVIEVTFRTPAAEEAIRRIRAAAPEVLVGAGTILSPEQARVAVDAGAQFGMAPGTNPEVVATFTELGVPFMPGVATPSEIERAIALGCQKLKFFPAKTLGGPDALKAMNGPYAHLGIEYYPTGGISLDSLPSYSKMPFVTAVGGSWIATRDDIREQRWSDVARKAAEAIAAATSAAGR